MMQAPGKSPPSN